MAGILAGALVGIVVMVGAVVTWARTHSPAGRGGLEGAPDQPRRMTATLDVPLASAGPAAERLADETATRLFASSPSLEEVQVLARDGGSLGQRRRRPPALADPGPPALPLRVTRRPSRPRSPDVVGETVERAAQRHLDPPGGFLEPAGHEPAHRALATSFQLPKQVRDRVTDADSPTGLVRAILEAGGHHTAGDGNLIRADPGEAIIVIPAAVGHDVSSYDLNAAWYAFKASGAGHGVVLTPGRLSAGEIRRREVLAPNLRHAGLEGIQRMADALALGGDPLPFATTTTTTTGTTPPVGPDARGPRARRGHASRH